MSFKSCHCPYIEDKDVHLQRGDVRFEPRTALAAGPDGMRDLEQIMGCARDCLKAQGWLMLEHGYNQADKVKKRLKGLGYDEISAENDAAGLDRVCMGRK